MVEERGAKLDQRENQKHWIMTPMFRACVKDRLEVIQILLQNGARIDFGKNLEPFTEQFFNDLDKNVQKCIKKHIKLRKTRLFMMMHYVA